ncbi:MAG: lipopolysaccharide biosynthesis protein [Sinobacteraceae bacterium]|nr:lipopolysaccharide biosynthesis protein [Nevskiaceae bacterium]
MDTTIYTRGRARRSLIDTVSFRVLSQLATMLGMVILVRGISEQQFGVYSLLYTFISVVGTLLSLGLEQVLQRYQPEYLRHGNKRAAAWLMRTIASGRFIANVVVILIVLLCWGWIAPLFKLTPYRGLFAFFSILILLHFQARILQLALGSHMMHRFSVGSMSLLTIVKTLVYAVLYLTHKLSLQSAIAADLLGYACAYLSMRIMYNRRCLTEEARGGYRPERAERKRLLRYGLLNNFNDAGVFFLYSTMDNFFIAAFLDTVSVGIFSFYTRLRQMVLNALPAKQFENIVQPLFFSIPAEQADRNIPRYFSFLFNMNLLILWPAFAFSVAYHRELVQLVFHGKFVEHSWLFPVLMLVGLCNTVSDPATLVAQYEEKAGTLLVSKVFAGYNVLAMLALVPYFGILGAAIASGTAQTLKTLFIWWRVRHRARWLNARASLLWSTGVWAAAVAVCEGIKWLLPPSALIRLTVGLAVFVPAALLYVRTPALSGSDRDILRSVMPDRAARLMQRVGLLSAYAGA